MNKGVVDCQTVSITILRNFTYEPIHPILMEEGKTDGFNIDIKWGGFNTALQDASESKEFINDQTDVVILHLCLRGFGPSIGERFSLLDDQALEEEINLITGYFETCLSHIKQSSPKSKVIVHGVEMFSYPLQRYTTHSDFTSQNHVVSYINDHIKTCISHLETCYFIDNDMILRRVGYDNFYDFRFWFLNGALYSNRSLQAFCRIYLRFFQEWYGKPKKCLILDCDNTLWGGVVGEDGIHGLLLGPNGKGSAYQSFQRLIQSLRASGFIIALCSKNNESDVWEVFDHHPDMILSKEDISEYEINWNNKADNIRKLSSRLNIGLDSCVFIDDSAFEINLVRSAIPQVSVIHLDNHRPSSYQDCLLKTLFFEKSKILADDVGKAKQYHHNKLRSELKNSMSLDEYISSLNMVIHISLCSDDSTDRVAQMSQKTNQFNLCTHRYVEDEIKIMLKEDDYQIYVIHLSDRFGSLGIIGFCIIEVDLSSKTAEIKDFALSCRALGRCVEDIFLNEVLMCLQHQGFERIEAMYIKSRKNHQTENFYDRMGFELLGEMETSDKKYALPLISYRKLKEYPEGANVSFDSV